MKALWARVPFRYKLVGSFFLVIFIGFAAVYFVNAVTIVEHFSKFNSQRFFLFAERAAPFFLNYHAENDGWDGLGELLHAADPARRGGPPRDPRQYGLLFFLRDEELIVADAQGFVVFDLNDALTGQQLPAPVLKQGYALTTVEGQTVGVLLSGVALQRFTPLAQQFFRSLNQSTLLALLIAVVISLLLITLLVRHLARPLKAVTQAAEAIAAGRLDQRVAVTSQDEIGQLAVAFNTMSARLKQSEELRQQMTVDIAHELRTPVSVIQGNIEALVDGIYPPSRETFQSMLDETHRLSHLIEELRELTLLDAGEMSLEVRQVDLNEVIGKLVGAFAPQAEAKGIALGYEGNGPAVTQADPDRIAQVVRNLLSNAVRYTPQGGRVAVCLNRCDDQFVCAVADTGLGMSADEAEKVFQRFWRADQARVRHGGGSGLGLAIAKRLVEAHRGALWLETEPGQGSTFFFSLPLEAVGD